MRIAIVAVGRLGRIAEAELARDYAARATAQGRSLGLGPIDVVEVEPRRPGKSAEAEAILTALGDPLPLMIACDERGEAWTSRGLSDRLAKWRDAGERRLAFLIGGPDGHGSEILQQARGRVAFGPQTWPHALARVMLAEQLYRGVTILAGTPYHRD